MIGKHPLSVSVGMLGIYRTLSKLRVCVRCNSAERVVVLAGGRRVAEEVPKVSKSKEFRRQFEESLRLL